MRVLVTGATGWIGSAVVPDLIEAGHEVVGLARSDASADALEAAGGEVVRGSLDDLELLGATAAGADGVIHLAFKHELAFSGDFAGAVAADRRAIDGLSAALEGSGKPLVIASGLAGHPGGVVVTETDAPDFGSAAGERMRNEQAALALAERGVRSASVRLSPTVHGDGDTGFVGFLVGIAREKGVAGYIGDGQNHWPAVHRLDAARLFRLAVESAPPGSVLHGVADEGVPLRAIAEVTGRHLGLPVESIAPEAAAEHFGWLAPFVAIDVRASSERTRELVGWKPTHPGLVEDLEEGHYFQPAPAGA
jgi:nucleoside-diphosphate-sugar epimerase